MESQKYSLETHVHKFLCFCLFFVNYNSFIRCCFTTMAQRSENMLGFVLLLSIFMFAPGSSHTILFSNCYVSLMSSIDLAQATLLALNWGHNWMDVLLAGMYYTVLGIKPKINKEYEYIFYLNFFQTSHRHYKSALASITTTTQWSLLWWINNW